MKYSDRIEHEPEIIEVRFFTKDGRIRAVACSVEELSSNKVCKVLEYLQSIIYRILRDEGYIESDV